MNSNSPTRKVRWWLWIIAVASLAYLVHALTEEPELPPLKRIKPTPSVDLTEPASCI